MKNENQFPCRVCGALLWAIGKMFDSLGRVRYPWYCKKCGYRSCFYAPFADAETEDRPLVDGNIRNTNDLFGGAP